MKELGYTLLKYRWTLLAFTFFLILMPLIRNCPSIEKLLELTPKQPWGIITSMLTHWNNQHLYQNLQWLIIYTFFVLFLYIISLIFFEARLKVIKTQDLTYFVVAISSQVIPSFIQYVLSEIESARGLSLVVDGIYGLCSASFFALIGSITFDKFSQKFSISFTRITRIILIFLFSFIFSLLLT